MALVVREKDTEGTRNRTLGRWTAGCYRRVPDRKAATGPVLNDRLETQDEVDSALPQISRANVLLGPAEGVYKDVAKTQGVDLGGWAWDTKIADVDNDGDPDLVTHPVNGPMTFFRDNAQTGNANRFVLQNHLGNRDGIGTRMAVMHGDLTQMRENQLGGGFISLTVPAAHFGLGSAEVVDGLSTRWRDGHGNRGAATAGGGPGIRGKPWRELRRARACLEPPTAQT